MTHLNIANNYNKLGFTILLNSLRTIIIIQIKLSTAKQNKRQNTKHDFNFYCVINI